ncbi:FAD-dependent oxidoreductase [Nitrososphaera sp.]|uniref:NAD(P)/FAD-dependent oxidoreductase n=1 Tax=Nitrososphaera sp. TaxID=1971748 RepID=UPI0017FB3F9D|nr:FAD-dependent oxidoreductase [Nitrososphaera sp.]NWG36308.1 FAD-dependent oxidoreductase [Nitrososphaera sp.]
MYKVAVIGGGVLGTSIAYFLSGQAKDPSSVALIEQERDIARHTSSRNTGKVHAPFLYDPAKKKTFAKAAYLGFEMWERFAKEKRLPFVRDGVLEVALDDSGIERLHKYIAWGEANGLEKHELRFLYKGQVAEMEPNVRCESAIYCSKDGSVDYGAFTRALLQDLRSFGCTVLLGRKATRISRRGAYAISTDIGELEAEFIVNAAGGNAVDIAHWMGVAKEYTDLHFRGEYWQAPEQYHDLTKLSIYSVPRHAEYPFLDPHWIVRADGRREVGPNAVPVFGPYAYGLARNLADMIPKMLESSRTGARKVAFDRKFVSLASTELKSSLSKTAMINRVKEFLPAIRPSAFTERGTAGIRSSVVDSAGRFVPDTLVVKRDWSLHVLNYNSPGATGALPVAAAISAQLIEMGALEAGRARTLWDPAEIAGRMDRF